MIKFPHDKISRIYRHGDLLIKETKSMPVDSKQLSTKVLAEGETTGHVHELTGQVLVYEKQGKKFFDAKETIHLTHQEHKTIQIDPGTYQVIHEREYDAFYDAKTKWLSDKALQDLQKRQSLERQVAD